MDELWQHVSAESDSVVSVGLKRPAAQEGVVDGQIEISDAKKAQAIQNIAAALSTEILETDDLLPLIRLQLKNRGALQALSNIPFVDYVEPAYLAPENGIVQSGCGVDPWTSSVETVSPGDVKPAVWGLEEAWDKSTGRGITVGVVGTGVSMNQSQLMGDFDGLVIDGPGKRHTSTEGLVVDPVVRGRTLTRDYTTDEGNFGNPKWNDDCGHETRIIGNIAAPRDGESTVGIAYGASIYSVRVDDDVVARFDTWELREGIRRAAQNSDIVNMAFGWINELENVEDEIEYQYNRPEETLFIGAAGTTTWVTNGIGVLFPANMSEVVAVTGLGGDPDDPTINPCSTCHYGPEVEFSTGTDEPVLNPYIGGVSDLYGEVVNMGGSSYTTSVLSGLAALVWSRYPTWSRDQVISRLKYISQPHHDDGLGYVLGNASCAVGDLCRAFITGPQLIEEDGSYTWNVEVIYTGDHSLSYEWEWVNEDLSTEPLDGTTSTTRTVFLPDTHYEYPVVRVTITEGGTGKTLIADLGLIVEPENSFCEDDPGECGLDIDDP